MEHVSRTVDTDRFVKLTLSRYRGADRDLQNVYVRPVSIREVLHWQFVYRFTTRDVTLNVTPGEGVARVAALLENDFRNAHLFAADEQVTFEQRPGNAPLLRVDAIKTEPPPSLAHDRAKARPVDPRRAPWLQGLGVTDARGGVCKGMEAKFRQINKFVEILQSRLPEYLAGKTPLRLVDMGCGKGYLTFAAYDWLRGHGWADAEVVGLEMRADLVELANRVATEHGLAGLRFKQGTIADAGLGPTDVLVALHACDTATDDALAEGVRVGASLILVAPCCHKELRLQLQAPLVLASALQHGILLERQAELVTDALRADVLEWAGYETRVFEFIATEHTAKNLMIAAVRRQTPTDRDAAARRVRELAAFYGIRSQRLMNGLMGNEEGGARNAE